MARIPLLELHGIHKVYRMGDENVHALSDASLRIFEGEFVSIVGPSGSGKSTMLQILGLLDRPSQGIYSLDGHSVENLDDHARSRLRNQKIGFVFQNFNLLPRLSALRTVEMPLIYSSAHGKALTKSEMRARAEAALARVGLATRMNHRPNELSGGQRQRVAIARALVSRPRLILADEPTGNLDSNSGREILALFQELHSEGATVVLVTHDPWVATNAQRMISMLDGRIQKDVPCQSEKSSSSHLNL